jgi:pre-mRNA-splicing factor 38B
MSRAALWHQQSNIEERDRRAQELFEAACEQGRNSSNNNKLLPLWGTDSSFHFHPLLLQNTIHSSYFQKACTTLTTWNAVIDEIYNHVTHLEPCKTAPSTAFCLLLRLLTMRMTPHQLELTLTHEDSAYIRGIGFLYLRYVGMPTDVYAWIQPYLHDEQEICILQKKSVAITIGEFVRNLFGSCEYYGTILPRYPANVEQTLKVKLLAASAVADRAKSHLQRPGRVSYFSTVGARVMALYEDDDNPLQWYSAVVDRVLPENKFIVTFTEYGNTETVGLGEMDVMDGDWKRLDPEKEIKRRERERVTASSHWARRPPSLKDSLAVNHSSKGHHHHDDGPQQYRKPTATSVAIPQSTKEPLDVEPPRKRPTTENYAQIAEKKRRLAAKYG